MELYTMNMNFDTMNIIRTGEEVMNSTITNMKGMAVAMALVVGMFGGAGVSANAQQVAAGEQIAALSVEEIEQQAADNGVVDTRQASESARQMGSWLGQFDKLSAGLERSNGFLRTDDEIVLALLFKPMEGESMLLRRYMTSVVASMDAVPDTFYTNLDTKVAALWSEINRVAPHLTPVSGETVTGAISNVVASRVQQTANEATVVRTMLSDDKWTIRFSELGLPKSEYRKGFVLYRLPGQDLVVCQQIVVERPYFSGTLRESDYTVRLGFLRLQQGA